VKLDLTSLRDALAALERSLHFLSSEMAENADLRDAFRESDLPFKVDLVEWAATKDAFRHIIGRESVVVREAGVSA